MPKPKKEKSLFEKARETAAEKPAQGTVTVPQLALLASLKRVIKAVQALYTTTEAQVKESVTEIFVRQGLDLRKQPKNFDACEGAAKANCQMRRRAVTSRLSEEEANALQQAGVSVTKVVAQVEAYQFNPKYKNDSTLLGKVSKAICKIPGVPPDLIVMQEEVSHYATTEESITEAFQKCDREKVKEILKIVAVVALKIADGDEDAAADFALVEKMLCK